MAEQPDRVNQFKILLCGRTGVGKTTLCNSLLGRKVCKVNHPGQDCLGTGLEPGTKWTTQYDLPLDGIKISIFDSPGLQDGTGNEKKYLEDMYSKCKDVDLVLYCAEMSSSRFMPAEISAVGLFTKKFTLEIWKRSVIVLTKANCVYTPEHNCVEYHKNTFESFQSKFCSLLKKEGVRKQVFDDLHMVAAGNFDPECPMNDRPRPSGRMILYASKHTMGEPGLPVDFIPELWVTCLETVPEETRVRFLQATALGDRIRPVDGGVLTQEELRKFLQPVSEELVRKIQATKVIRVATFELNHDQQKRTRKAILPIFVGTGVGFVAGAVGGGIAGARLGSLLGLPGAVTGGVIGGFVGGAVGAVSGFAVDKYVLKKPVVNKDKNV